MTGPGLGGSLEQVVVQDEFAVGIETKNGEFRVRRRSGGDDVGWYAADQTTVDTPQHRDVGGAGRDTAIARRRGLASDKVKVAKPDRLILGIEDRLGRRRERSQQARVRGERVGVIRGHRDDDDFDHQP